MPIAAPHHNASRKIKQHKRKTDRSAYHHLYGRRWQAARLRFLALNPLCVACKPRIEPATVVDHIIDHKGDLAVFWDQSQYQSLCARCHNQKTGRENGFQGSVNQ